MPVGALHKGAVLLSPHGQTAIYGLGYYLMAERIGRSLDHTPQNCNVFSFPTDPNPPRRSSFPFSHTPSPQRQHSKRPRPLDDVDGEGSAGTQKKKRRLRLILVTSRLSPPFSLPATYIASRGLSKIAVWAKQKAPGRSLLRKVAIMNRVRKRALQLKGFDPVGFEMVRRAFPRGLSMASSTRVSSPNATTAPGVMFPRGLISRSIYPAGREIGRPSPSSSSSTHQGHLHSLRQPTTIPRDAPSPSPATPRTQFIPLPQSPSSLTDYDIFDDEHDYLPDSDNCDGESGDRHNDREGLICCDFNVLEPSEPVVDDHDSLSAFDSLCFWGHVGSWIRRVEG